VDTAGEEQPTSAVTQYMLTSMEIWIHLGTRVLPAAFSGDAGLSGRRRGGWVAAADSGELLAGNSALARTAQNKDVHYTW